jgi:hypothetical protein
MPVYVESFTTPCLTKRMSPESRRRLREIYRKLKRYRIRGAIGTATGGSFCQIAWEISRGELKTYGKRKIGAIIVGAAGSAVSGGLVLATNATRIAKYANATHKVVAAAYRTTHNMAELPFLVVDYALFGEPVSSCQENDYNWFGDLGNGSNEIID